MIPWVRPIVVVVVALIGLSGCSDSGGSSPKSDVASSTPETPEPTSTAPGDPVSAGKLPRNEKGLNIEKRNANDVLVRVTGISYSAVAVTVSIEALNASTTEALLAIGSAELTDDRGKALDLVAPKDNALLTVPVAGELKGDLSFPGLVDPSATTLTLRLNGSTYPANRDSNCCPGFEIPIPIRR